MNLFSTARADFAHGDMDDFAIASMLFNDNQEPTSMVMTADTTAAATRRFRTIRGRATSFLGFEDVSYKRVHGRFGGDSGNRKRRVETRIDDNIEHTIRTRVSKLEAREAIEYGVAEYESRRRQALENAKRDNGARTLRAFDGTPIATTPEGMVRQSRTGALVEVIRKTPRVINKSALASVAVQRPRLTTNEVRAKLGLPARG
jgi:hypothetical protein